jgi:hypothetical protein
MLIETTAKAVCSILRLHIQSVLEKTGMEEQNGFATNCGCTDGLFSIKVALQKRREHGLDTWALFVDLILVDKGV